MSKNLYITTAIPYVNGAPHIGHALDYLLADVFYRYHIALGESVRFQSGTDEHGNKIFNKAKSLDIPVETYVKENSDKFREFIKKLNVAPTDFIRTSDPDHCRRCQLIWQKLSPHIYPATYEGWYCSGCERFVTDKEHDETSGICPDHQTPYERLSEKNYYLKISDFKAQIKTAIETDTLLILPEFRKKEVLNLLESSPDVSISRPRRNLSWGIPVPGDDDQVMYVWIDALANYLTVLGYPESDISDFWPADVQFVGKDILRFHAIIWPAILLGLGLPLPKAIISHGHILSDGQKMSKSLGNVVDPLEAIDRYGLEPFRYFFLRHIDTFADSDFTWDKYSAAYSGELANDLGNFVQRLSTLISKANLSLDEDSLASAKSALKTDQTYQDLMSKFNYSGAFDYIWSKIQTLNKTIDEEKPWSLLKTDPASAKSVLSRLTLSLLEATSLLAPFLPATSEKIFNIFSNTPLTPPSTPLFPKA
ncbi:methionine--tRNA ligase [Candidatus Saccharibacteria bacterium]|nr:methionine--tRNA ligase [Candidatus Saccharibacteria bacterium]